MRAREMPGRADARVRKSIAVHLVGGTEEAPSIEQGIIRFAAERFAIRRGCTVRSSATWRPHWSSRETASVAAGSRLKAKRRGEVVAGRVLDPGEAPSPETAGWATIMKEKSISRDRWALRTLRQGRI